MVCEQDEVSRRYFASAKITPQNLTLLYSQLLVKVRFRTRNKSRLVNESQCYLYHAIIFKSREIGVKIGLSELFGVFGLFVGFCDWRQTAGDAFAISL